ncbi:DDE-type integrase/transposase/recombinase [Micromonospora sp. NPDC000316]|uniref:DDE-type integrase/transposase/recombinase n=1 Tax=Micromonospora sp. NPDC000316 TaxID=3364216 RepID=UPI003677FAE8
MWRYVYRAVDQHGQINDVLASTRRHAATARRFFHGALTTPKVKPSQVVTDAAPTDARATLQPLPSRRSSRGTPSSRPPTRSRSRKFPGRVRRLTGTRPSLGAVSESEGRSLRSDVPLPLPVTVTGVDPLVAALPTTPAADRVGLGGPSPPARTS